jgi:SAM-dependent methyltransferase
MYSLQTAEFGFRLQAAACLAERTMTDFPALMAELSRLGTELQKYAAIGAALRLKQTGEPVHPDVDASLRAAIAALLPGALDGPITHDEISVAINSIIYQLEDARELLKNPSRPPVWCIEDPSVLQSMGDMSRVLPRRIMAFAADRPALAKALTGRFLDVGTGVGAIALEAAARNPTLKVVGLDIWDPAIEIAKTNVAASAFRERIEIRKQSIVDLAEKATFTLAFLAAPFMGKALIETALDRLAVALAPEGYLVVSIYIPPADSVIGPLTELRRVRNGGYPWTVDEMSEAIKSRSFMDLEIQTGLPGRGFVPTLLFARRSTS